MLKVFIRHFLIFSLFSSLYGCSLLFNEEDTSDGGESQSVNISPRPVQRDPILLSNTLTTGNILIFRDGEIQLGKKKRFSISLNKEVYTACISEKGTLISISTRDGFFLYEIKGQDDSGYFLEEMTRYEAMKVRMISSVFLDSEEAILFGGSDSRVYRWKFNREPSLRAPALERYSGHGTAVSAVAGLPATPIFFTGDWFGILSAWLPYDADRFHGQYDESIFGSRINAQVEKIRRVFSRDQDPIQFLKTQGDKLFIAGQSGNLEQWKVRGMKKESMILAHKAGFVDLEISVLGTIATLGRDGAVKIWNQGDPLTLRADFPDSNFILIEFSKDGEKLFGVDKDDRKTIKEISLS